MSIAAVMASTVTLRNNFFSGRRKWRWLKRRKKTYFVKCTVNMCANDERSVIVKATKPHLAMQKAEAECRNNGCFHAKAFYCNEMKEA